MILPDVSRLQVSSHTSRLQSLTLQGILSRTQKPTAFFITISLIELGKNVLKEHLDHMTAELIAHPELQTQSAISTSYSALKRLVWLIQKINENIQTQKETTEEEELTQNIIWFSETLEQVARMYEACTDELMDAVVVCSITIYIHAASLPNVVPILSFEPATEGDGCGFEPESRRSNSSQFDSRTRRSSNSSPFNPPIADLVSIGKSVTELAESMEGVYILPIPWKTPQHVFLPREEDMWKIWHHADHESKAIIGYELLRLSKTYIAVVEDHRFDNMATWGLKAPQLMSLCRKKNPYALLLYSYFLATMYFGLPLYDKLKRVQMDIVDIREQVPENFRPHLDWPLEICCGERRDFDTDYELFLAGKLRQRYLRRGEEEGRVRGRPGEGEVLEEGVRVGLLAD